MEQQMDAFWQKMKQEMSAQTREITEAVTKKVSESINEKLTALVEENNNLKTEVKTLQDKIKLMEDHKRKNNIIFFGMQEEQNNKSPIDSITKLLEKYMNIHINPQEINNVYRLGAKQDNKPRPILVTFTTNWRKNEILKNKKKLDHEIYIKEDLSKEILEKRKELLPQLQEERAKGKICYFVKDKIVIKESKDDKRDKRKRDCSTSPNNQPTLAPKKINKTNNMLNYMVRGRSASLSTPPTTKNDQ
ncbi:unnamed protein product [Arctia plantaginis]|uniref:Endonuclease-reverse transcriptase n=1 Tax=Arctia plantaginis TaxID=874455 RepID=A0A8S1BAX0_ARCPL|nr:unnamed protein product [Arctia plantaginis]CAB3250624.1 unnamed protein product [Arctia plantaginis]CAB3258969.1 unnamed protein product [Arctia plantaginis]